MSDISERGRLVGFRCPSCGLVVSIDAWYHVVANSRAGYCPRCDDADLFDFDRVREQRKEKL